MNNPPWFLLYGGESEDGRGPGRYMGRTTSPEVARQFYLDNIKGNSYSVGRVEWVDDQASRRTDDLALMSLIVKTTKPTAKPKGDPLGGIQNLEDPKPAGYGEFA